jgi:hypothetical protein
MAGSIAPGSTLVTSVWLAAVAGQKEVGDGHEAELNGTWLDAKLSRSRDVFTIRKG